MDNDFAMGYALGSDSNDGKNVCVVPANNGGWGGNGSWGEMIFAIIILAMFAGGDGFGNGGLFGGGRGGVSGEVQRGFDTSAIVNKLDGINGGLCDGFYATQNSINGLGMNIMQGFSQAELSRCNQQSALMQQLYQIGYNQQDCCCQTQRAIDGVNYNMATNTCALQNTMHNNTRDIIDSQNAGTRAILDYLCQDKISTLQNENQALRLAASQSNQNAVLMAAMDANKADILRRTGAECPTAAYIVQPPTPVNFPTNCCGQFSGWNNGCNNCGC